MVWVGSSVCCFFFKKKSKSKKQISFSFSASVINWQHLCLRLQGSLFLGPPSWSNHTVMITHILWRFWTIDGKPMFLEHSAVHISVCKLDALFELDWLFSQPHPLSLMYVSHIACVQSVFPFQSYNTCFLCINYEEWRNILHPFKSRSWKNMWYVPIVFQMFSCGKGSCSAVLKPSDANLSLKSAAFSFCFL